MSCPTLSPSQRTTFRLRLLAWYHQHRRDLPWRPTRQRPANAYHILLSEAMLQQTQVATVVPYFERFIDTFPTLHDLAAASEQQVLALWQGLGYYRRARNLHAAARTLVAKHDSQVPQDVKALMHLPGIGRYTAGAIASIAFDLPEPIVDGNVARVLARHRAIDEPIDHPPIQHALWDLAHQLVPRNAAGDAGPGEFNQAMMELGALVCTPRSPQCTTCPLKRTCLAHRHGLAEQLPVKSAARKPVAVTHHVAVIDRAGKLLFEQRPERGLWSNMWQLPTFEDLPDHVDTQQVVARVQQRFQLRVEPMDPVMRSFTHQTTHRTITFIPHRMKVVKGRVNARAGCWRNPRVADALQDLPLPRPQQHLITQWRKQSTTPQ